MESKPVSLCSVCLPKYGSRPMSFGDIRTGQCDHCGKNGIAVMDILIQPKECPWCSKMHQEDTPFCNEDCEESYLNAINDR